MKRPISFIAHGTIPVITDPNNESVPAAPQLLPRRIIPPMANGAPPALPGRGGPQYAILLPQDIAAINGVTKPGVRL